MLLSDVVPRFRRERVPTMGIDLTPYVDAHWRRMSGTRLWTCCAGRAGTPIRSEALHPIWTIGRRAAHRAGARPIALT